ncbi:MAG: response regulator [Desulfobacterales bacterium]|nr:response regulator [Desulfobacterales bacterium]
MTPNPIEAARKWNAGIKFPLVRRQHLFNRLLVGLVVMCFFSYGANLYKAYVIGSWEMMAIYLSLLTWVLVVAFARRMPFPIRCWMGLLWFFIVGCYSFFTTGVLGGAWIYLICFSVFGVIFWGAWAGVITLGLTFVVVIAVWALKLQYGIQGLFDGSIGFLLTMEPIFTFLGLALPYLFLVSFITFTLAHIIGALEGNNEENQKNLIQARRALDVKDEKIQTLERKLRSRDSIRDLGMMAGLSAHDLNNLLTGMATYPDVLLMEPGLSDATRSGLEMIKSSGKSASALVTDLLNVSRGARADHGPVNLNTVVERYLHTGDAADGLARFPGVEIETDLEPDLANVKGSYLHLEQVVIKLLAFELESASAFGDQGRVMLSTSNVQIEDKDDLAVSGLKAGTYVCLSLWDNGSGLSSAEQARMYEPFFVTKRMGRRGTGLDLALVRATVRDHQGRIRTQSNDGGTCFKIYFPCLEDVEAHDHLPESMAELQGRGQRILVLDDRADQRKIASTILKNLGYEVASVGDGMDGVNYLKRYPVDLVVIDAVLESGLGGRETFQRMKDVCPGLRAVMACQDPETPDVDEILGLGAGQVVIKPYTVFDLGAAVRAELRS